MVSNFLGHKVNMDLDAGVHSKSGIGWVHGEGAGGQRSKSCSTYVCTFMSTGGVGS